MVDSNTFARHLRWQRGTGLISVAVIAWTLSGVWQSDVAARLRRGENIPLIVYGTDWGDRTDVLMMAALHPKDGTLSFLSIPRDTWIHQPNIPYRKINAVYRFWLKNTGTRAQAAQASLRTLEKIFLDGRRETVFPFYIGVDYTNFIRIVDGIGGIPVEVPAPLYFGKYLFTKGRHRLSGFRALRYVRARGNLTDVVRVRRLQQVIFRLAKSFDGPAKLLRPWAAGLTLSLAETNMSVWDRWFLGTELCRLRSENLSFFLLPGRRVGSVWRPDNGSAQTLIRRVCFPQHV